MKLAAFIFIVFVLAPAVIALSACGEDSAETGEPSQAPGVVVPSPAVSAVPTRQTASRTNIPAVDAAIDAVLDRDDASLRNMLVYSQVACTAEAEGIGGPPLCEAGEPDGTLIEVVPVAQCEGFYARDGSELFTELLNDEAAPELYAVYNVGDDFWPPGRYAAMFSRVWYERPDTAFELIIDERGITGLHVGCAMSPPQMVQFQGLSDPIVAPAAATGIATVDRAIAALRSHDASMLRDMVRYTKVGCGSPSGPPSVPTCAAGTADGTPVDAFITASCEGEYMGPEKVPGAIERFVEDEFTAHSIYRTNAGYTPEDARYTILLQQEDPESVAEVVVNDDGLVKLNFGCGGTIDDLVRARGLTQLIYESD
jgi:hypothetical protein